MPGYLLRIKRQQDVIFLNVFRRYNFLPIFHKSIIFAPIILVCCYINLMKLKMIKKIKSNHELNSER